MNKSFTLLEVIVAILVITIGVLGAFSVVQNIISYTFASAYRLEAAYLAKEGIEIVRNIRDTNWVDNDQATDWDDGLGAGDWEADYDDSGLTFCSAPCNFADLRFLKVPAGGFYNYNSGTDTKFKRKITVVLDGSDKLKVFVEIQWQEKGDTNTITVQENLYNWF